MGFLKPDTKSIEKWEKKGAADKIADALAKHHMPADAELRRAASAALARIGAAAVPALKARIDKGLKDGEYILNVLPLARSLDGLGETDYAALRLSEYLVKAWHILLDPGQETLLETVDILEKRPSVPVVLEALRKILFQSVTHYDTRCASVPPRVAKILIGVAAGKDDPRWSVLVNLALNVGGEAAEDIGYALQFLGWGEKSLGDGETADPVQAKERYDKAVEELGKQEDMKEFLKSTVLPDILSLPSRTVAVGIDSWELFPFYSADSQNMKYERPMVCAGCLSEEIAAEEKYTLMINESGGEKSFVTMSLPFCQSCAPLKDVVVGYEKSTIIFYNASYGYAFAKANEQLTYMFYLDPKRRSERLRAHLKSLGRPDMTMGLPVEAKIGLQ